MHLLCVGTHTLWNCKKTSYRIASYYVYNYNNWQLALCRDKFSTCNCTRRIFVIHAVIAYRWIKHLILSPGWPWFVFWEIIENFCPNEKPLKREINEASLIKYYGQYDVLFDIVPSNTFNKCLTAGWQLPHGFAFVCVRLGCIFECVRVAVSCRASNVNKWGYVQFQLISNKLVVFISRILELFRMNETCIL